MTSTPGSGRLAAVPSGDDRFALWDAAYVLGSLAPDERREYEAHLSACARCRAAVAEIGDLPTLLGLLNADEVSAIAENAVEPPPPPPDMQEKLVGAVGKRRRRTRIVTAAVGVLAAAVLAVGLLVVARPGVVGLQREQPAPPAVAMDQVRPSPVQATVALTSQTWGTAIDMTCTYGSYSDRNDDAQKFALVVVGRDGERDEAATWTARPGSSVTVSGSTSTTVEQIASVQLVSADTGEVLLQRNL